MKPVVYLIGSLRNDYIPRLGNKLREVGVEVFDDWYAAGPEADDYWQRYEKQRGRTYAEALEGWASKHVVKFDYTHLKRCDAAVLVLPAGKSAHMEAGWVAYTRPVFVLFEGEPTTAERWDQMYGLVFKNGGGICFSEDELMLRVKEWMQELLTKSSSTRPF